VVGSGFLYDVGSGTRDLDQRNTVKRGSRVSRTALEFTRVDWHCGLLDDPVFEIEKRNQIRYANWHTLPEELERELRIWLAMPGFSLSYHVETLERDPREISQFMGGYAELEEDVLLNWLSATREDCVKLGWLRPDKGDLPLISKIEIRRDYMRGGMTQTAIAKDYGVWPATVHKLCWGVLPDEVLKLPPRLQELLKRDPYVSAWTPSHARRLAELREAERQLARRPECALSPEMLEKVTKGLMASAAKLQEGDAERERERQLLLESSQKAIDALLSFWRNATPEPDERKHSDDEASE
jgi:hypothetical protein